MEGKSRDCTASWACSKTTAESTDERLFSLNYFSVHLEDLCAFRVLVVLANGTFKPTESWVPMKFMPQGDPFMQRCSLSPDPL